MSGFTTPRACLHGVQVPDSPPPAPRAGDSFWSDLKSSLLEDLHAAQLEWLLADSDRAMWIAFVKMCQTLRALDSFSP